MHIPALSQKHGQERIDSLLAVLPGLPDSEEKVELYVSIMTTYNTFDREKGFAYEQPALDLAQKLGTEAGVAKIKNVVGRMYWRKAMFTEATALHREALDIFRKLEDASSVALTIRYIGQDYADYGRYPEALKSFFESLEMYEHQGDSTNMSYLYNLLAWVYGRQANYLEAARYSYLALELFEEMGDKDGIAVAAADVAEYNLHMGEYSEALKYFTQSRKVYEAKGDRLNVGFSALLLGKAYLLNKDVDKSMQNYQEALSIGRSSNDSNIQANAMDGLADVYHSLGEYDDELVHRLAAAEGFRISQSRVDLSRVYSRLGGFYQRAGDFSAARGYFDKAFLIASELSSRSLLSDYYQGMERLDSAMGNWKSAYQNHKKYIINRDSIFNQDKVRAMVQMQLKYEFEKREEAARAAQRERDLRVQRQFVFMVVIAFLALALLSVLYLARTQQVRAASALKHKTEKLEEENREKNSILNIVSHDLKAPFNKIKGLADLMMMTENLSTEEKRQYLSHIQTSIDQGNYLINNLLEAQNLTDATSTPVNLVKTDIVQWVRNYEATVGSQLLKKKQILQVSVQVEPREVLIDGQILTRILDNLISNASKFTNTGANVFLRVWKERDNLCFSVRDEGPGISQEDQKLMFRKFQKLGARPTAGEGSTGLGLSITKALVEKLNGTIEVQSQPGRGTEMIFKLPS